MSTASLRRIRAGSATTYDDFIDRIRRIAAGEANVLTREPVRLLEPPAGRPAAGAIPVTGRSAPQFRRGVTTWIYDLLSRRPAVRGGRAYWSISPMLGPPRRSPGGLPIGFDDDAAYLGRAERFALRRLLVTPPEVARLPDMDSFRYVTLLSLLAASDLAMISVWSPTFLTALLDPLEEWRERLCDDLRRGRLSPPAPMAEDVAQSSRLWLRPDPRRADLVARVLGSSARPADRLRGIWPRLSLISCWADAVAARFLPELRERFPGIEVQPKGLLATEGFVSFPLFDRPGTPWPCARTSSSSRNATASADAAAWPTTWTAAAGIASS